MALKSTLGDRDASPPFRSADKSKPEHSDQDQVGSDNEIEQARNNQDSDASDERDDRLQMTDTDDHDGVPLGLNAMMQR